MVVIIEHDELLLAPHEPARFAVAIALADLWQGEAQRPKTVHNVSHDPKVPPAAHRLDHSHDICNRRHQQSV